MTRLPLPTFAADHGLTYRAALNYAERHGYTIGAYDPDINAAVPREGLTANEAADIAAKDADLVFVVK
jgi:hypothetical protein